MTDNIAEWNFPVMRAAARILQAGLTLATAGVKAVAAGLDEYDNQLEGFITTHEPSDSSSGDIIMT